MPYASSLKTRILVRHGAFELNQRAQASGEEAERLFGTRVTEEMHNTLPLLEVGEEQAQKVGSIIRRFFEVRLALFSPYRRTAQSAEIGFGDHDVPIQPSEHLKERDRGIFAYQPAGICERHQYYRVDASGTPKSHVLDWRPASHEGTKPRETVREAADYRLSLALQKANEIAPSGCVVLITSADIIIGGRYLLGGATNQTIRQPLIACPPQDECKGLQKKSWLHNGQADVYYYGNPVTGERSALPEYFMSFSASESEFASSLIKLPYESI